MLWQLPFIDFPCLALQNFAVQMDGVESFTAISPWQEAGGELFSLQEVGHASGIPAAAPV